MGIIPGLSSDDSSIVLNDNLKYVERLRKEFSKTYGAEICKSGTDILDNDTKILKIGPSLNAALNGGLTQGSINLISGKQKSGKTTSVLSFVAACQAAGLHVYYHDIEWRLKKMNLAGVEGLKSDSDHLTIIRSEQGRILKAEDHLTIIEKIANTHVGAVIIMDSSSALCSEKEFNAEMSGSTRADAPKLFAQFCRKLSNIVAVNKITLVIIQHMIANSSGYGPSHYEDGGNKLVYSCESKIRVKSSKNWTVGSGDNEKTIGLILTWQIVTGALGSLPGTECTSYIRFNTGIDYVMEYIDLGLKLGFIEKAGAWFSYGDKKVQGEQKLYDFFKENPTQLNELKSKLCDIYGFEI